jgi:biopolymer transport protein ExbB
MGIVKLEIVTNSRAMKTTSGHLLLCLLACWVTALSSAVCVAQEAGSGSGEPDNNPGITQEELQAFAAEAAAEEAMPASGRDGLQSSLNFLALLIEGGALMIPIAAMSLLVVTFALERWFALRRARIFPRVVRREIRKASESLDAFEPQVLFIVSEKYPSAASRVLQDMLRKLGRPVPEAEAAITEGSQREADAMYSNVRWLTLAAAVTPLLGLLGTVWGMIIAFYNTTQLGTGTNKAEFLAEGIYVALVTTLGGLAVAIPAAIFAHYFEGKISRMLARVDDELRRLLPGFEALEGKARYDVRAEGLVRRDLTTPLKAGGGTSPPVQHPSAPMSKSVGKQTTAT